MGTPGCKPASKAFAPRGMPPSVTIFGKANVWFGVNLAEAPVFTWRSQIRAFEAL